MNKTAKRGKNKGRKALYLSKWCKMYQQPAKHA